MPALKVILVDDNREFLECAKDLLQSAFGTEVIGQASSGEEAVQLVERLSPDLVFMDVAMPRMNGFQATQCIKASRQSPKVIIVSINDGPEYRASALSAGADGFVCKSEFASEFLTAILPCVPKPI